MFSAMVSRKRCCTAMPRALACSGPRSCRTGRGQTGNGPMLATVADRGPEPLVGRLQELGVGLVPELGVGERGHVALEVLLADALRPLPGAELGGEVGAGAGRERARDALRDRLVRRARLLEAAAQ